MNNNSDSILLIDNYDSFTFNLVQLIEEAGGIHLDVIKHDEVTLQNVKAYDRIVFSPGPDIPSSIPIMHEVLKAFGETKKILGVCLGHQAIGEYFGATIYQMPNVVHGIQKEIEHGQGFLYKGLDMPLKVGVYHSWAIDEDTLPPTLTVTARSSDDIIMSIKHKELAITGIQFHPESYLTEEGQQMMQNWLLS